MKKIGGFFELEISQGNSLYHDNAIKLSTGRACLNLVIQSKFYTKFYLPYYCCDALFEPIRLNNIPFEFYRINNEFEMVDDFQLKEDEAIIYCDFFGIKNGYIDLLIDVYKEQLIIDNSHSFFNKGYASNISFTTARKYFGVPDGAFLYMINKPDISSFERNTAISIDHNVHRLIGLQNQAFKEFTIYEHSLNSNIHSISVLSENILKTLNYNEIQRIRNENFNQYKDALDDINLIIIPEDASDCFCYPLLLDKAIPKEELYRQEIFVPSYWTDVVNRKDSAKYMLECKYSKEMLPLPVDHRYNNKDIKRVVNLIKKLLNEQ